MDPFEQYTDKEIWTALETVNLRGKVFKLNPETPHPKPRTFEPHILVLRFPFEEEEVTQTLCARSDVIQTVS
jgi:hypothetical protein